MNFNLVLNISLIGLLTACGGSGSGSDTNQETKLSVQDATIEIANVIKLDKAKRSLSFAKSKKFNMDQKFVDVSAKEFVAAVEAAGHLTDLANTEIENLYREKYLPNTKVQMHTYGEQHRFFNQVGGLPQLASYYNEIGIQNVSQSCKYDVDKSILILADAGDKNKYQNQKLISTSDDSFDECTPLSAKSHYDFDVKFFDKNFGRAHNFNRLNLLGALRIAIDPMAFDKIFGSKQNDFEGGFHMPLKASYSFHKSKVGGKDIYRIDITYRDIIGFANLIGQAQQNTVMLNHHGFQVYFDLSKPSNDNTIHTDYLNTISTVSSTGSPSTERTEIFVGKSESLSLNEIKSPSKAEEINEENLNSFVSMALVSFDLKEFLTKTFTIKKIVEDYNHCQAIVTIQRTPLSAKRSGSDIKIEYRDKVLAIDSDQDYSKYYVTGLYYDSSWSDCTPYQASDFEGNFKTKTSIESTLTDTTNNNVYSIVASGDNTIINKYKDLLSTYSIVTEQDSIQISKDALVFLGDIINYQGNYISIK